METTMSPYLIAFLVTTFLLLVSYMFYGSVPASENKFDKWRIYRTTSEDDPCKKVYIAEVLCRWLWIVPMWKPFHWHGHSTCDDEESLKHILRRSYTNYIESLEERYPTLVSTSDDE